LQLFQTQVWGCWWMGAQFYLANIFDFSVLSGLLPWLRSRYIAYISFREG